MPAVTIKACFITYLLTQYKTHQLIERKYMKLKNFKWDLCNDFLQVSYQSEDLNREEMVVYSSRPLKLALNLQSMLGEKALSWSKAQKLADKIINSN